MNRRIGISAVMLMLSAPLLAASASAHNYTAPAAKVYQMAGTKQYTNPECKAPVKPTDFKTWACTTIIVPKETVAGQSATVTFIFTAKTKLRYVHVCFGKIDSRQCAYHSNRPAMNAGKTIKQVLKLVVPVTKGIPTGMYNVDNKSKFYKLPKYADTSEYWSANARVRFVVPAA